MEWLGEAQRMVEYQFLNSFRTGNIVLDSFITGFIIAITTTAFFYLKAILFNWQQYMDRALSLVGMKTNKIVITWKVSKPGEEKVNSSRRFDAILHQVMRLQYDEAGVSTLLENPNPKSESFLAAQGAPFTLAPDVHCSIRTDQTEKQGWSQGQAIVIPETFVAEVFSKTRSLKELQDLMAEWLDEYLVFDKENGVNEIQFFGRLSSSGEFNFSETLFAIMHKLETKASTDTGVKVLKEFLVAEEKRFVSEKDRDDLRSARKLIPEEIEISDFVFAKVTCGSWESKEGQFKPAMEVTINIRSKVLKVPELVALVNVWEDEYIDYNQRETGLMYFVFNPPPKDQYRSSGEKIKYYTEFTFESGKTFNNLFFPEKRQLLKKIKFFHENESWYLERGIPHMLGLLLHGEPGCGKTSTIKASANLTKRHIISVPLKNVHNSAELYEALYGGKVDKRSIPMNKRLYVLEDIDCGGLEEIVSKRKDGKDNAKQPVDDDAVKGRRDDRDQDKQKELTLSDLLEAFDGVLEMKGRLMVITTNHLEKLDPALIRPGRVDTSIEFKRCSKETVMEIFGNFYASEMAAGEYKTECGPLPRWSRSVSTTPVSPSPPSGWWRQGRKFPIVTLGRRTIHSTHRFIHCV
jgi:hypothetical protein